MCVYWVVYVCVLTGLCDVVRPQHRRHESGDTAERSENGARERYDPNRVTAAIQKPGVVIRVVYYCTIVLSMVIIRTCTGPPVCKIIIDLTPKNSFCSYFFGFRNNNYF